MTSMNLQPKSHPHFVKNTRAAFVIRFVAPLLVASLVLVACGSSGGAPAEKVVSATPDKQTAAQSDTSVATEADATATTASDSSSKSSGGGSSLPAGPAHVFTDRDSEMSYGMTVVGKDSSAAATLDGFNVTVTSLPSSGSQHYVITGALLPKLTRTRDGVTYRLGSLEVFIVGGKNYLKFELPDLDVVCGEATATDISFISNYDPEKFVGLASGLIEQLRSATNVVGETKNVDGVPVKSYSVVAKDGGIFGVTVADTGQITNMSGSTKANLDFFGTQINGSILLTFDTKLSGLSPVTVPPECKSAPLEYRVDA